MPPGQPQETRYTSLEPPAPGPRVIHFPEDRSCGEIVVRDWGSPVHGGYRSDWEDLGFRLAAEARGPVSVPAGQEAGLALAEGVEGLGGWTECCVRPDDLQYVLTGWRNSVTWTDDDCRHLSRLQGSRLGQPGRCRGRRRGAALARRHAGGCGISTCTGSPPSPTRASPISRD